MMGASTHALVWMQPLVTTDAVKSKFYEQVKISHLAIQKFKPIIYWYFKKKKHFITEFFLEINE